MPENTQHIFLKRYPGVKPFSVSENFLFFGRETDLEALNTLIFIKQTVVLYGKSGYGKSSLINAGIIPRLKKNELWIYFSIRFNNYSEKETGQNLSPAQTVKQRFAENILLQKDNILDILAPDEDSFWYWIKQNQFHKRKANFIIFFDQFEELFTYPKEQVEEFSEQLSQLLYTTLPVNFKRKIAALESVQPISDPLHDFLYEKPEIKVIFSIRSDRLSLLNTLTDKHPSILQNCYELDALNIADARKAIVEPAKLPVELGFDTPAFAYTEDALDKIINNIANPLDGKIEAATLQIVCLHVENNLVAEKKCMLIDAAGLGNITDIFQQYYEGILSKLKNEQRIQAQRLIEDELIVNKSRNALREEYITDPKGIAVSIELLKLLEQSSLLRKERDASGRIFYEISHDSLVDAIEEEGRKRKEKEKEEEDILQRIKIETEKAALQQKLAEKTRREEELIRLRRRSKISSKIAWGLVAICVVMVVYAIATKAGAEKDKANAVKERIKADSLRVMADSAKLQAQKGKRVAEQSLFEVKKISAKYYMERGDRYIDEYENNPIGIRQAIMNYDSALYFMKDYEEDALYINILNKIKKCELNSP